MPTPPQPPPDDVLGEMLKDAPPMETAIEMPEAQPARGQLVQPLPTPGTVPGGVADAGGKLLDAGVSQAEGQQAELRPEVRELYERIWGGANTAPALAPEEQAPAPSIPPPAIEPDF